MSETDQNLLIEGGKLIVAAIGGAVTAIAAIWRPITRRIERLEAESVDKDEFQKHVQENKDAHQGIKDDVREGRKETQTGLKEVGEALRQLTVEICKPLSQRGKNGD